ncbi:hypothetical protein [Kitasatospora herbaricolor]|uniref:hypothetical protein n=1 Tax=Kitasatospora herbaricolor TaxID=68217 RepID=UPI0036DD1B7B
MTPLPPQNPHPAMPVELVRKPFDQELCELVLDTAPRLFAVVQVCDGGTSQADGWVVAWGLADGDGPTHVVSLDGRTRMTLASPERALRLFAGHPGVTARLVWLARSGAATLDRAEAA